MEETLQASPLLALPAELRNKIYEEVLTNRPWKDIDNKTPPLGFDEFKHATGLT
jgi:hypothetical protein